MNKGWALRAQLFAFVPALPNILPRYNIPTSAYTSKLLVVCIFPLYNTYISSQARITGGREAKMGKRIFYFIVTNVLVLLTISIIFSILPVVRYIGTEIGRAHV